MFGLEKKKILCIQYLSSKTLLFIQPNSYFILITNEIKIENLSILQAYVAVKVADCSLCGTRGDVGIMECAFVAS